MKPHCITYQHNGKELTLYLEAESHLDAWQQVLAATKGEAFELLPERTIHAPEWIVDLMGWGMTAKDGTNG